MKMVSVFHVVIEKPVNQLFNVYFADAFFMVYDVEKLLLIKKEMRLYAVAHFMTTLKV